MTFDTMDFHEKKESQGKRCKICTEMHIWLQRRGGVSASGGGTVRSTVGWCSQKAIKIRSPHRTNIPNSQHCHRQRWCHRLNLSTSSSQTPCSHRLETSQRSWPTQVLPTPNASTSTSSLIQPRRGAASPLSNFADPRGLGAQNVRRLSRPGFFSLTHDSCTFCHIPRLESGPAFQPSTERQLNINLLPLGLPKGCISPWGHCQRQGRRKAHMARGWFVHLATSLIKSYRLEPGKDSDASTSQNRSELVEVRRAGCG